MATAAPERGVTARSNHLGRLRTWLALAIPGTISVVLLVGGIALFLRVTAERRAIEERAQDTASAVAHAIERVRLRRPLLCCADWPVRPRYARAT